MAETPSIPPLPVVPAASGAVEGTPVAPAAPVAETHAPLPQELESLPVRQAPSKISLPQVPVQTEGRVIDNDRAAKEIRIQTPQGEIRLQSPTPLPPDTRVLIELFTERSQTLANLVVVKQRADMAETLEQAVQPAALRHAPPPLKEGAVIVAMKLPDAPPSLPAKIPAPELQPSAKTTIPLEQLAKNIETIRTEGLQKTLMPPPALQKILDAPDVKALLQRLPPEQIQEISSYVAEVEKKSTLPPLPAAASSLSRFIGESRSTTIPAQKQPLDIPQFLRNTPAPLSPAETIDSSLLNIMRAQMFAKATHQTLKLPPDGKPAVFHAPPEIFSGRPAGEIRNPVVSGSGWTPAFSNVTETGSHEQKLSPPDNFFRLNIIKILPPDTPPEQVKLILQKAMEAAVKNPEVPPQSTAEPRSGTGTVPPRISAETSVEAETPLPHIAKAETPIENGQPVLKTESGTFVARTPVSIPSGSTVIITAVPMTPEEIEAELHPVEIKKEIPVTLKDFDPAVDTTWPALEQALKTLEQSNPPVAKALHNTLPSPSQHLVPAALFFLAALRLGTVDNWLGDNTMKALRDAGKKDIADRIGSDFGRISAHAREPLADDWKAISMPLRHDEHLSQLQFYVRHQHDPQEGEKGEAAKPLTRFILNLHLSRMGDLQLDGFIRKKSFDIILRTGEKLPFDMRQELMLRFAKGLSQVNMQGGISFQTRQQGWVTVEPPPHTGVVA